MTSRAIVTGSASGIGRAVHEQLAGRFDEVIGIDLADADVAADLSDPMEMRRAAEEVERRCADGIDAVVCCAGVNTGDPAAVLMTNYFGTTDLLDALRPLLAMRPRTAAVATSSYALGYNPSVEVVEACLTSDRAKVRAAAPASYREAYSASKLAVARWVRRTAPTVDWIGQGISLNSIAPGLVRTRMVADRLADRDQAEQLRRRVPMPIGTEAEPADLAAVIDFLVSPKARFVVGQVIFIDGGADALARPDALARAYTATGGFTGGLA